MTNGNGRASVVMQIGANIATIVAAIVAIVALTFGSCQYRETSMEQRKAAKAQQEEAAVNAMKDHLEFSLDHIDSTTHKTHLGTDTYRNLEVDEKKYAWYASHSLFSAETIYNLQVGANSRWETLSNKERGGPWVQAAKQLVHDNKSYILWNTSAYGSKAAVCTEFSPGFISLIEALVPKTQDTCQTK